MTTERENSFARESDIFKGVHKGIEFEISRFVNPLEELAFRHSKHGGSEHGLELISQARALSENMHGLKEQKHLQNTREKTRRMLKVSDTEIERLSKEAEKIAQRSFVDSYLLMELVQAAAVGNSSLPARNVSSARLAVSAKNLKKFECARKAYADAIEGLDIMKRFFNVERHSHEAVEQTLKRGWGIIKHKSERRLELFDPVTTEPAKEWFKMVIWNSDFDSNHGLLAQIDATLRLAIRLKHWRDCRCEPLAPEIEKMLACCEDLRANGDSLLSLRCMVTLGDALIEIGEWHLGSQVYCYLQSRTGGYEQHPLGFHALVQGAYCSLMEGNIDKCSAQLQTIHQEDIKAMSRIVLTMTAGLARYLAVDNLSRQLSGKQTIEDVSNQVRDLLKEVSVIVCTQSRTRVDYLRTLFYTVLARDIELLLHRKR